MTTSGRTARGTKGAITTQARPRTRYTVDPTACAVLVEARSNVGEVSFGTRALSGGMELVRLDGRVDTTSHPCVQLSVPLASLTSGNALYDAELQQRLAVQRYPVVTISLTDSQPAGGDDYLVSGQVTLHGVTALLRGAVTVTFPDDESVLVVGEQVVDIRDFEIDLPSVLMLRIYPDVKVSLHLVARRSPSPGTGI